jgi:hypothetical protein
MRKSVVAVVAVVMAMGTAGAVLAQQGPGGPGGGPMGPGGGPGMMQGGPDGQRGWHNRMHAGREGMGQRPFSPRDFALLPRVEDKKLTTAEVQKIAEGMLLWMGNRTWKVVDVKEAADNKISFGLALPEGGVVARFDIDRKTGAVKRAG